MNFSVETLFLQHLSDLERLRHKDSHPKSLDWENKFAISEGFEAAAIGRCVLVTEQLSNGQVKEVDDYYRVACILSSTGATSDMALAHVCVLRIFDLKHNNAAVLSPEFEKNLKQLMLDTWAWLIASISPPA